jgi:hypothetical protein
VFLRTSFQILFGLTLGLSGATACLYLGLLVRGSPDGWTAATLASLLIAAQACAAFVFRKRIVLPAILGFGALRRRNNGSAVVRHSVLLGDTNLDASCPITWRSGLAFLLLVATTQGFSFLAWRSFRNIQDLREFRDRT